MSPIAISIPSHAAVPIELDASLFKKAPKVAVAALPVTPPDSPLLKEDFSCLSQSPISPDTEPLVAVIGVGYVGTHLVSNFSRHWDVLGFDLSDARVQQIRTEPEFVHNERASFTSSPADLADATHFLISVPTLLLPDKTVDASFLKSAIETVFRHARRGATVVIESSVAIGMTRELLGPLAQARGCFAGMSPERVDPGRVEPPARLIPKVISGLDDMCPGSLAAITRLYSPIFQSLVPVSRPEVAEMTKLYENCQRMINIAYANEMADACAGLGIDPFEVCGAAASKPFGYMDYSPGLGVGGHCIPVNPWYLLSGCEMPLLRRAAETMNGRPAAVGRACVENMGHASGRGGRAPRVLVVGVGFKKGQSTLSYSPGLEMAREMCREGGVEVVFADPLVTQEAVRDIPKLEDGEWSVEGLQKFDLIMVVMRQVGLDFDVLERVRGVSVKWWCR